MKYMMTSFDKSNQVVSGLGAFIACTTITLLAVAGFFIFKVYFKGEKRIEEPLKIPQDGRLPDEVNIAQKPPNGPPGSQNPPMGPGSQIK